MTDTSDNQTPPTLNWESAPQQFREAHARTADELKKARDEAASTETLKREIAMLKAGVDSQHPAFTYFNAGYSGNLAPEDIRAEWTKITGATQAPQAPPEQGQQQPPAEAVDDGSDPAAAQAAADLQAVRDQLGAGVPPGEEPSPDPNTEMMSVFHAAQAAGDNRLTAQRKGLQVLMNAAVEGDPRVVSDTTSEHQEKWKRKHGEEW